MFKSKLFDSIGKYRFEFRHLTVLFIVLVIFQIILSFIQKSSLQNFLEESQRTYQQYSAENIANLTSTSLELLLENVNIRDIQGEEEKQKIIQSFNIIFNQQLLQQNVEDIFLIVSIDDSVFAVDDGEVFFNYLTNSLDRIPQILEKDTDAIERYEGIKDSIELSEQIYSQLEGMRIFHIFVPFVPNGEFHGVLYICMRPDFTNITDKIISSYDEVAIIYTSLILLALLAMYYISSFTVRERDETYEKLLVETERHIKEEIMHEKESLFTKRIYHTHHKAEKVMGFIKEDLRNLNEGNLEEVKDRVTKYSNFISRVIYDMKWYDPPIQTIRNQMFNTDINGLIRFLIKYIFLRISSKTDVFEFIQNLDPELPKVHINEFVVWEILEPLIQNSIEHATVENVKITINTRYDSSNKKSYIEIIDNSDGIPGELMVIEKNGIRRIFNENVTTKHEENKSTGYGCYIAHQMATKKCGWKLDVQNNPDSGATFTIIIPN
ncbi:ATP-binding protein [Bacteroidota bacterium]